MNGVLVVEGDPVMRRLVVERLERVGLAVLAQRSELIVSDLAVLDPDLVVLELTADADLAPLLMLRRHTDVATIVLLPTDGEPDVATALDAGADDGVTKPISLRELGARATAVLRRARGRTSKLLEFPGLVIDRSTRLVEVAEAGVVELPQREFDLLAYLASAPGQVFSREQILEQVWGSSEAWRGTATVTEHVYRLRRRLGPVGAHCISTVRSVGYRFTPPGPTAAPPPHPGVLPSPR